MNPKYRLPLALFVLMCVGAILGGKAAAIIALFALAITIIKFLKGETNEQRDFGS